MKTFIGTLTLLWLLTSSSISQVNFEWAKTYNGPADSTDIFGAMVLDQNSSAIITGSSIGSGSGLDFFTVKYSSAGAEQWTARYNSTHNNNDNALAIDIDNSGNTYITGNCYITQTSSNLLTVKYNSSGAFQWAAEYSGSNSYSSGYSIVADGSGNTYVTGIFNNDIITVKYNSSGAQQWVKLFNGTANGSDEGKKVILYQNNIYVVGYITSAGSGKDIILLKYDLNGTLTGTTVFNNPLYNKDDYPSSMKIDSQGNIYVVGNSVNPNQNNQFQLLLVKIHSVGTTQWYRLITSTVSYCLGYDLAIDGYDNVYVAGQTTQLQNKSPLLIAKYNPQGVQQWMNTYSRITAANYADVGYAVDIDNNNYIYVLDLNFSSDQPNNYRTMLKYNSNGNLIWSQHYQCGHHTTSPIEVGAINIDVNNNIFTSGGILTEDAQENYLTLKYSQNSYTISGLVTFSDNNQPVNRGYVKALYYDHTTTNIITVDSVQIQSNGNYTLPHCITDSLFIMVYQNDEYFDFVPTYYPSTTNWLQATKVYPNQNLSNINVQVFRINNNNGQFSISGHTFNGSAQPQINVNQAIVYIQSGGLYKNYGVSNTAGIYSAGSLAPGNYTVSAFRMGYNSVTTNVTIVNSSLSSVDFDFSNPIGIQGNINKIPEKFKLYQNYPNPFNPSTNIKLNLPKSDFVKLVIYDLLGREIEVIVNENLNAGSYSFKWNASNYPSGLYFYKLTTKDFTATKKMILLK